MSPLVREGFDEKLVGRGKGGALRLRLQPVAYIVGEAGPFVGLGEEAADAAGEVGAHRHARAAIGRDARRLVAGVDEQVSAVDLLHLQHQAGRSEEHTSELQSLMRISYAVFCLKKKKKKNE